MGKSSQESNGMKFVFLCLAFLGLLTMADSVFAENATLGTMAENITKSFKNLALLITAGCYIAGLGFAVTAILQFKQHKDNPTQIPIGKPIGLVFIAAALLFLPSILQVAGYTMFGQEGGKTAGPTGVQFTGKL